MLTNHEMLLVALHPYKGQTLKLSIIKSILLSKFPKFNLGSFLPNDHSQIGNKSCCSCVGTQRQLFIKVKRSTYQIV